MKRQVYRKPSLTVVHIQPTYLMIGSSFDSNTDLEWVGEMEVPGR